MRKRPLLDVSQVGYDSLDRILDPAWDEYLEVMLRAVCCHHCGSRYYVELISDATPHICRSCGGEIEIKKEKP